MHREIRSSGPDGSHDGRIRESRRCRLVRVAAEIRREGERRRNIEHRGHYRRVRVCLCACMSVTRDAFRAVYYRRVSSKY